MQLVGRRDHLLVDQVQLGNFHQLFLREVVQHQLAPGVRLARPLAELLDVLYQVNDVDFVFEYGRLRAQLQCLLYQMLLSRNGDVEVAHAQQDRQLGLPPNLKLFDQFVIVRLAGLETR